MCPNSYLVCTRCLNQILDAANFPNGLSSVVDYASLVVQIITAEQPANLK